MDTGNSVKQEQATSSSHYVSGKEESKHASKSAEKSGHQLVADVTHSKNIPAQSMNLLKTPRMPSTLDDFEVLTTIGIGSYGTCKKIRRKKDGKVLVWKEMDYGSMTESEKQMLVSEVNLLRELRHEHIVRYYDRIIDRNNTTIYIIMEFCEGGDLATLIAKSRKEGLHVDENFAWKILVQMTLALQECHRRKNGKAVLHRDLKPANVFLDADKNVKLGDFGLARVLHHETSFAKTYVGTPYYMSPELVNNMSYNEKSDIWAMGCMLYELCALYPPFTATSQTELNRKIRIGDFARLPSRYSDQLDQVIRKMIRVEVVRRPGIEDILNDSLVVGMRERLSHRSSRSESDSSAPPPPDRILRLEEELRAKLRQLDLREKELDSRERSLALKEKLADDKLKRAMELLSQCKGQGGSVIDENLYCSPRVAEGSPTHIPELADLESPHSCLSKGKKEADTPKKRVSFDMYGKENLRHRQRVPDYVTEVKDYDDIYTKELAKRQELKDRLIKAKVRAFDYGGVDIDTKYKARNLLYFR
ncbi:serine/threonine-protein kinase Nek2-like isoform X1 [Haliotis rubra]|uniref:serine/threonine-protein kinase Nek2-like isoform X1 n=2 Tax=Haliotis rubra TaxID=36100 RepID=UPI001EE55047|nr:serine/threonine-protein kinase Nek2-like isoform X1 [Haliotis rubra]